MAKKNSEGLHYFQVDIDIYEDEKIILAQELIDPDGMDPWLRFAVPAMAIRLLREIFKNGYSIEFNDRVSLTLASKMNSVITMVILKKIISVLLDSGFFSQSIYTDFGILTSHGIQERWFFISKNAKRKNVFIRKDIDLLTKVINVTPEEMQKTPEEMQKTPEESEQSGGSDPHIYCSIPITIDNKGNKSSNEIISTNKKKNTKTPEEVTKTPEEVTKTPEEVTKTPEEVTKTPEEVTKTPDFYKITPQNQHFPFPIEACLWHYLNSPVFKRSKDQHCLTLNLDPDPAICEEKIVDWANAFNKHLISQNKLTVSMSGGAESWLKYFPSWVRYILNTKGYVNPNNLFSPNGIETPEVKKKKHRVKTPEEIMRERGQM